jgi:flavin reductase
MPCLSAAGISGLQAGEDVKDEPPTLLACINRSSRNNAAFRTNGKLCVNVLSVEQQTLAATLRDQRAADR